MTKAEDVAKMCGQIIDMASRVGAQAVGVFDKSRYLARDGYPSSSMGGGSGSGISDPVLSLVIQNTTGQMPDPIRDSSERMLRQVHGAFIAMGLADNARAFVMQVPNQPTAARESTAPVCVNPHCGGLALWKDRLTPKAGRCPACYEFKRRTGRDRVVTTQETA